MLHFVTVCVKSQCQRKGWDCYFLTRSEIPGAVFARAQRRSSSTTSLSLYLDLKTNRLENPISQRYVVGNGRRHNTVSDRTGYYCKHLIQNWHCREINSCWITANKLREVLCAVSETSSTLTVNALLASTNGVSGKLGKYDQISSASMCKYFFHRNYHHSPFVWFNVMFHKESI